MDKYVIQHHIFLAFVMRLHFFCHILDTLHICVFPNFQDAYRRAFRVRKPNYVEAPLGLGDHEMW